MENGIGKIIIAQPDINFPDLAPSKPKGTGFASVFKNMLTEADSLQHKAENIQQEFLLGEVQDIHTVMISAQKAAVAFSLVMEIRNKLLEGYQELIRMPL